MENLISELLVNQGHQCRCWRGPYRCLGKSKGPALLAGAISLFRMWKTISLIVMFRERAVALLSCPGLRAG